MKEIKSVKTEYRFSKNEFLKLLGLPEDNYFSVYVASFEDYVTVSVTEEK